MALVCIALHKICECENDPTEDLWLPTLDEEHEKAPENIIDPISGTNMRDALARYVDARMDDEIM